MTKTNLDGKSTRTNRASVRTREGGKAAPVVPAGDVPAFHCPSCGTTVAGAAEVVQGQEQFLKKLFDRQDELQRSLASSIHDDLAQQLAGALLYLEGAQQSQSGARNGGQENFCTGLKLLRDGIHEARRIAGRLQPLIDRQGAVELGIEYLIHEMRSRGGPEIVYRVEGDMGGLAPEMESAVFRIVRELLANACRHSRSEKVCLKVAHGKSSLRLEVEDRGVGFDLDNVDGKAFGLQEVQQRTKLLGGDFVVDSAPGKGTRVVVSFPI